MNLSSPSYNHFYESVLFSLTLILAFFLYAVIPRFDLGNQVFFNIPLLCTYLWSLRRSYLSSPFILLVVGVLQDLIYGAPMGVFAASYIIGFGFIGYRNLDITRVDLWSRWSRFLILSGVIYGMVWLLGCLSIGGIAPFLALVIEAVIIGFAFPIVLLIFPLPKVRSSTF